MKNNTSRDIIERYLRQELSPQELSDFTFQLVMNPSLRQEVEATRQVFKTSLFCLKLSANVMC